MKKSLFVIPIILVIAGIGFLMYTQIHQSSSPSMPISANNTVITTISPNSQPSTTQNTVNTLKSPQSESNSTTPQCPQNLIDELDWTKKQMDALKIKLKGMPKASSLPVDQAAYWNNLISQWNDLATSYNALKNQLYASNCNMP